MSTHGKIIWILLGMAALPTSGALAEEKAATDSTENTAQVEQQRSENQGLAHKMMGHIDLASFALDVDLPDQASHHVKKAKGIEMTLASQLPEVTVNSSFKFGKVTYDDSETVKDHYIPVIDNTFLISDYSAVFEHANTLDLDETNAGIVHVGVSVDLQDLEAGLDSAQKNIENKEYTAARESLQGIFKSAIISEQEIDDPIMAITDNLSLAESFVDNDAFDSARLTLKHVQSRLDSAKDTHLDDIDKETINDLSEGLAELQEQLHQKDPTVKQRMKDQLSAWGHTVKGWFKS